MSDSEQVAAKRKKNRLSLDSEEEARIEAEERERQEEKRLRHEERRRRKEEEARLAEEEAQRKLQLQQRYENPLTMLQADSNSHDSYGRIEKKIRRAFPDIRPKDEPRRKHVSASEESEEEEDEDESESQQQSSSHRKKAEKKAVKKERREKREDEEEVRANRQRVEKAKVEEEDPKERLVKDVAVRWWYCLPPWPPVDYDYEEQLKKNGYRLVEPARFRMQENNVNGFLKATPLDGYVGVFRTKVKIIDLRPKESCPSLKLLRGKSMQELTQLLRVALREQIAQLQGQKHQRREDEELLTILERRLLELA